jgi:5-methylcytosine-specific restriction endonuclease McrA
VIGSIPEYIHTYTGECALCGEEFDIFHEDTHKRGTLDRINNDNVITPDNIQWLCYSCNTGKQDMTNGEYINKLKRIVERYGCE